MTDEELIARLRDAPADGLGTENLCLAGADRIEALVRERDQWIEHTKNAVWSDSEELELANDRIKGLVVAGRAYREATRHFKPCPETSANFDTALKGN